MIRKLATFVILSCLGWVAAAAPASEASLRELFVVMEVQKAVDAVMPQMDQMMKMGMQQGLGGRTLSPEEQKQADAMRTRMLGIIKEELSWEKLEPMYIKVYQQSLTQEEVEGLVAFYKSPAGVAFVKKMPAIMQNTMVAMQQQMGPVMQKVQAAVQETVAEIKAGQGKARPESKPEA